MRILYLSWWWPYPANNGSKIRAYNLIKQLAKQYEVTLLSFAEADEATPEQVAHLRGLCAHVEAIPKPRYDPATLKSTIGYLSKWPRSLVDVYSAGMESAIRANLRLGPFDVVIASNMQTIRYLELMPDVPAILDDIEIVLFHNQVEDAEGQLRRFRAQLTLGKMENMLEWLLQRGVVFSVASEDEKVRMQAFAPPEAKIAVIPNGVDTESNKPNPGILPQPNTLIYSGAVTYSANLEAVTYFIQEVMPLIRAQVPDAHFTVTGRHTNVDISALAAEEGVTFTGYLPEVATAIQSSYALIVPLHSGGGTRLKVLEAMALGVPVISTNKGAEGLGLQDGDEILIANSPLTLANTAVQLFQDSALRAQLAAAGRARVLRDYDWNSVGKHMIALIRQAVG